VVRGGTLAVLAVSALLVACIEEPPPRSFTEFMDDSIAREGTLIRCNADRTATANDPECVNARRAASALAAQGETEKRDRLEAQSEARLLAVRQRYDAQQAADRQAEIAVEAEEQIAYESQWAEGNVAGEQSEGLPAEPAMETGSVAPIPSLEPVTLPPSVRPPLTTIGLPRGAKPIEYKPSEPVLEEIVLPSRIKPAG
jgi:hypothetical protein